VSKSPEAFRTISEVAEELALPQHVLRFWETRFTSIKPMKRGGGRRYYRPDDVDLLRGIRALLYGEGYTIRGVQRILKEQGPRSVIAAARGRPVPAPAVVSPRPSPVELVRATASIARPLPAPNGRPVPAPAPQPAIDDEPDEDDINVRVEPAFAPKEFRPAALAKPQPAASPALNMTLEAGEVRRLEATLAHLLELKRLLDSSRG
jgi:DNA-binding transcriptional MerR regulator